MITIAEALGKEYKDIEHEEDTLRQEELIE